MMRLKYTGYMSGCGLVHGNVYDITLQATVDHIVVCMPTNDYMKLHYTTPQDFADNWCKP